ncbi:MAG TPA: lamin tail domain-containing protein [Bacteroidales bacterium]|jgi:hypothetical protein|nr:lamin tail domain-containing protein [Bacteroidales bacterium]
MTFGNVKGLFFIISLSFLVNFLKSCPLSGQDVEPQPYDIIISEIMADPSPARSLPELEYIELFNRSSQAINLLNWSVIMGNHEIFLPELFIKPGEYIVITDFLIDSTAHFNCKTICIEMPYITNTGQVISVMSPEKSVIHSVNFSDEWYKDPDKDEGGWSIEIIDPDNPCGGKKNWHASVDSDGGTPGEKNSVYMPNPDLLSPILLNASLISDTLVLLHFNESLYYPGLNLCSLYSVNNGFYHPDSVIPIEPGFRDILLQYNAKFKRGTIYTVTMREDFRDCAGNEPADNMFVPFSYSGIAEKSDLVINEVLFKAANNEEFVEVFNRSDKVIELSSLTLSIANESNVIYKTIHLAEYPVSVFPKQYAVVCRSPDDLIARNNKANLRSLLEQPAFFSLPDEGALLVLADNEGNSIDEFSYNKNMHYELISETAGISLERVNSEIPSDNPDNWHSASSVSGFSTPGFFNSQSMSESDENLILMSPEILSPDGDGVDDEIVIQFRFKEPGWTGTVQIYTLNGNKIRTLIANSLLGTTEFLRWDGKDDEGNFAVIGLYLVLGEFFSSVGEIKNFKKVIPVVNK